jgi:DNA mismatch endonuclease (patch repair protein)
MENRERDKRNISALTKLGWKILIVWECQTRNRDQLQSLLRKFLEE